MKWMHSGYSVVPVKGSYRRIPGGYAVDVRSVDHRCPIDSWTAPADDVKDETGRSYAEYPADYNVGV